MAYRDRINILRDVATDGAPNPSFDGDTAKVFENVPANVRAIGGGERVRGRQIEASVQWLVEMPSAGPSQRITAEMVVDVVGGIHAGRRLQISKALPLHPIGETPIWQLECTEVT